MVTGSLSCARSSLRAGPACTGAPIHAPYSGSLLSTRMSALPVVTSLPVAAAAIWTFLRSPLRRRLLVAPSGDRWHTRATPLGGGVGVVLGFFAGTGAVLASGYLEPSTQ